MPLSEQERKQLEELERKRDEPEPTSGRGRQEAINYSVDLSDEKAVNRALDLGLLRRSDVDDDGDDDDADDDGDDADADDDGGGGKGKGAKRQPKPQRAPRKTGYFGKED